MGLEDSGHFADFLRHYCRKVGFLGEIVFDVVQFVRPFLLIPDEFPVAVPYAFPGGFLQPHMKDRTVELSLLACHCKLFERVAIDFMGNRDVAHFRQSREDIHRQGLELRGGIGLNNAARVGEHTQQLA